MERYGHPCGLTIAIVGAAAAIAAAIAAFGSWFAASKATAIDSYRRHDELAPEFDITCIITSTDPNEAALRVELSGGRLARYDNVTVSIQDNVGRPYWVPNPPIGLDSTEDAHPVWGPWEFKANAGFRFLSKRQTRPQVYSRSSGNSWDVLTLRRTLPTAWMTNTTAEKWLGQWQGRPFRILVTCEHDGHEPWFIQRDVEVEPTATPTVE